MKKLIGLLLIITISLSSILSLSAETGVRYDTFTLSNNRLVQTQTAYVPIGNLDTINGVSLGEPNDIHIDQNNVLYIATRSSGDGMIIIYDMHQQTTEIIGQGLLNNPTGIFVNEQGDLYIADRGASIAYRLNRDGDVLQEFTRPDSPLFGTDEFQPRKIVSDARGNVYILNLGSRGLAQFSSQGEFLGYFGTNTIQPTLRTILQYTFYTEEQRSRLMRLSPPEIHNVAIDQRGLIHTASLGVEGYGIKRLNISGDNMLPYMFNATDLVDVFVGPIGNIYAINRSGNIYEYDIEGNLLFMFGGQDISNQIQGRFNTPSAIAVDQQFNIFVLDRAAGELKIFMPTGFANLVHQALTSYQEGFYVESQGPWEEVLKMNDFFDLAHRGLGNAYYSLGDYDAALSEYRIAYDREGYSEAFWEVRNAWLVENMGIILLVFFTLLIIYVINLKLKFMRYVRRPIAKKIRLLRDKLPTLDEILYVFSYLKNPADASYEIKRQNRVGIFSASVLFIIFFLFYIHHIYNTSFLFNYRIIEDINLLEEVIRIILPVLLWVVANTLIASIREGEGRFKDIYVSTIFALSPFFLTLPLLTILSNVLTYNEAFMFSLIRFISVAVTVLYFFFMVKEVHFYNVRETVSNITISAFTMAMLMLGTFIVYMLLNELGTLTKDIAMEVYYRVFSN